ncbi:bile acid:sodium symporter family protein [Oceanimonas sp. NS1]|nr:bile acid:sodium symporter family protein [Oceanimonas sp. NS1]
MLAVLTQLFPLWALLLSVLAFMQPQLFVGIKGQIVPLLTLIMLCMGLTLNLNDFRRVMQNRKAVLVGVLLQFSLMPLIALLVGRVLGFGPELMVGMLLVGSVAGGTSSNVMCYLAKGDTALSISMTAISTLLGVVMTPLLVDLLVGQSVDVPVQSMLLSLLQVVVAPVVLGWCSMPWPATWFVGWSRCCRCCPCWPSYLSSPLWWRSMRRKWHRLAPWWRWPWYCITAAAWCWATGLPPCSALTSGSVALLPLKWACRTPGWPRRWQ